MTTPVSPVDISLSGTPGMILSIGTRCHAMRYRLTILPRFNRASQVFSELHRVLYFGAISPDVAVDFERCLPLT